MGAIATQAKIPTLVMNAASSAITTQLALRRAAVVHGAAGDRPDGPLDGQAGRKEAYTVVADYASGVDAETAFKKAFAAEGGKVVGESARP